MCKWVECQYCQLEKRQHLHISLLNMSTSTQFFCQLCQKYKIIPLNHLSTSDFDSNPLARTLIVCRVRYIS